MPLAAASEGKRRDQLVFGDGDAFVRAIYGRNPWFDAEVKAAQAEDASFPRVAIHDLRHTAASRAISAGANVKAVQKMLGHKSVAVTLEVHADLFDDDLDAVATALDDVRTTRLRDSKPA